MNYTSQLVLSLSAFLCILNMDATAATMEPNASAHFTLLLSGPTNVKAGQHVILKLTSLNSTGLVLGGKEQRLPCEQKLAGQFHVLGPHGYLREIFASNGTSEANLDFAGSFINTAVPPGTSIDDICSLDKMFDMSIPGEYTVEIRRQMEDNSFVRSNPLTISISP